MATTLTMPASGPQEQWLPTPDVISSTLGNGYSTEVVEQQLRTVDGRQRMATDLLSSSSVPQMEQGELVNVLGDVHTELAAKKGWLERSKDFLTQTAWPKIKGVLTNKWTWIIIAGIAAFYGIPALLDYLKGSSAVDAAQAVDTAQKVGAGANALTPTSGLTQGGSGMSGAAAAAKTSGGYGMPVAP